MWLLLSPRWDIIISQNGTIQLSLRKNMGAGSISLWLNNIVKIFQKPGLIWTGFVLTIISLVVLLFAGLQAFVSGLKSIDRGNDFVSFALIMWGLVAVVECWCCLLLLCITYASCIPVPFDFTDAAFSRCVVCDCIPSALCQHWLV